MPPAAISRSSTYFPKICGNIASTHRSAFPALLLAFAPLFAACAPLEPEVVELVIRAHSLDSSARCRIDTDPGVTLRALGPFPVSDLGAEVLPFHSNRTLTFPDDTRGVEAEATDFERRWHGYSDRRTESGIDVLLWKEAAGSAQMDCDLFHSEDYPGPDYPGSAGGQAAGYSPEAGVVLAAGGDSIDTAGAALAFDANTGDWFPVTELPFSEARAFATITPFGSELLLAGGEAVPLDPDVPVTARDARDTAAVYDPIAQGFVDDQPIKLELRRTRHAAVVLESGETLLVGGGQPTTDGRTVAVAKFEIVSPRTGKSTLAGVDGLVYGRLNPSAIRLDNGNVLVGGGYDADGAPVEAVEWFSPDASSHVSPGATQCGVMPDPPCAVLTPRHHRAFVPLPGSGALTVGGCAPGEQDPGCEQACGVGFGCPAPEPSATWIAPEGVLTDVGLVQPTSFCGTTPFSPERVLLAPGSDGSPWLFASDDDRDPPCRALFRFQPWSDAGACGSDRDERCPVFAPVELGVTDWPDFRMRLTSLGADAFVWISGGDAPLFAGARTGVRGALSQNETLLVTDSSAPQVPLHLAPDRPPLAAASMAIFTTRDGNRLILEPGRSASPAVSVYVTDARYDDVTVTLGFFGAGTPIMLLDSYEIGGDDCPWPENPSSPLVVTRRGTSVMTTDAAGSVVRCETAPSTSITLGFRAGDTTTTITSLGVKRD